MRNRSFFWPARYGGQCCKLNAIETIIEGWADFLLARPDRRYADTAFELRNQRMILVLEKHSGADEYRTDPESAAVNRAGIVGEVLGFPFVNANFLISRAELNDPRLREPSLPCCASLDRREVDQYF